MPGEDNETSQEGTIGQPLRRVEDHRLLTGKGAYTADFAPENLCHAVFVRSPHANAEITSIDIAEALSMPGVLAVLTGADAGADGLGSIPHSPDWTGPPDAELRLPPGFEVFTTDHQPLVATRVRFVGEPVAMVLAETAAIAATAAELVTVDYVPHDAVVDALDALSAAAPAVWDARPDNLALACEVGDGEACSEAFATAAHVVRYRGWVQRVIGNPMEPRTAIGCYDSTKGCYTLRAGSGRGVVQTRERLAAILGVPATDCRVVFGDMGGNFGTRNGFPPEYALVPWAAKQVGRPVKWVAERQECFLTDYQARDLKVEAELALDTAGNFLALRGTNTLNLGAYTVYFWPLRKGLSMMQSVYNIPAVHFHGRAVLTNTAPTAVYRSAGRPEAIYVIERLIERAARQCGFDRAQLRRQNLIPQDAMPFTNGVGVTYDSGDYQAAMDKALAMADWSNFAGRRADAKRRGRRRGIAVANYIEVTSGIPRERAELTPLRDGQIELVLGTAASGQGHETSFPQLVAEWLDIPFERISYVVNDTARVSAGGGSHSGRSMRLASIAIGQAVDDLIAKARVFAAQALQAKPGEVEYESGRFRDASGATIELWQVAEHRLSDGAGEVLSGVGDITDRSGGFPYGAHVCEVEVEPDTGKVAIVAWTAVDDVGRAVNPLILHGQAHGAVAQGAGQALLEEIRYDAASAQLLTGSFMDYAMPRADNLPFIDTEIMEVPASSHPHGIRPGGEGGTTPALGVVINAILDALAEDGVEDLDMPATPARVWRAIKDAAARQ